MAYETNDEKKMVLGNSDSEFDLTTTFLQIPVSIKDEVLSFIDAIADSAQDKEGDSGEVNPFRSQGCFFIVALERLEEMINILDKSLALPDNEVDKIKAEIRKVLIMLQGT
ncbi:MAG: hypothetical protein GY866_22395 [Proteobacteria bacterium]|nr:hypothetical protein [Pseudomonadota bacterium]